MKIYVCSLSLAVTLATTGCTQSDQAPSTTKTQSAPTTTSNPLGQESLTVPGTVRGQVATGDLIAGAKVRLYDFAGKVCGEATTDTSGGYVITPAGCTGAMIVAAERSQDAGMAMYGLITADEAKSGAPIIRTLTPISSVIALLVIGDHPQNVVYGRQLGNVSRITKANIDAAVEKVKLVLAPVLLAMNANDSNLIQDTLVKGKSLDLALDMLDVYLNVDSDVRDYSVSFWLPTLHRPLMLRNTNGGLPGNAYIDPSNGVQPSDVKTADLLSAKDRFGAVSDFVRQIEVGLNDGAKLRPLLDTCFLDSGNGGWVGGLEFLKWKDEGTVTLSNLRLLRYNIFADFDDEDHEQNNITGTSDLAQISVDVLAGTRKYRWYTWLVRGAHTALGCQSTGDGWRLYGNRSLIKAMPTAYGLYRTEVSSSFAGRKDTVNSGLEFQVADTDSTPINHVLVSGPGLASGGVVLVKSPTSGAFLTFAGSLNTLRNLDPKTDLETMITRYASVALTDNAVTGANSGLLGIADSLDDRRNTYTFRAYVNRADIAPTYVYKRVLHKRPYLSKEIPSTSFPILGFDNEQLLQSLTTIKSTKLEWSTPQDIWSNPILAEQAWYSRFGTEDMLNDKGVKTGTRKYKEFSAPDSIRNLWHSAVNNILLGTSTLPRGKLEEASLQFRSRDSDNRSVMVEYTFNLTR